MNPLNVNFYIFEKVWSSTHIIQTNIWREVHKYNRHALSKSSSVERITRLSIETNLSLALQDYDFTGNNL